MGGSLNGASQRGRKDNINVFKAWKLFLQLFALGLANIRQQRVPEMVRILEGMSVDCHCFAMRGVG